VRQRVGEDSEIQLDRGVLGDVRFEGGTLRVSSEFEVMEDRWLPTWLDLTVTGYDAPDLYARIEVRDGVPEVVALSWFSSKPGQREIKQKDLRVMQVAPLLDELYSGFVMHLDRENKKLIIAVSGEYAERGEDPPAFHAARRFVEQLRNGPGHRAITPEFLKSVADVYRRNIDHAPTQAVARTFGVKARMASAYVDRARQADYLPPTKQGKKKA
jgi:hypothetical protein